MATYAYDIQNVRLLNGRGTIQRVRLGNCNVFVYLCVLCVLCVCVFAVFVF